MPRISVIIPCFNMGEYLSEAVESVLAQTYRDFEIIIIDDASNDKETVKLLEQYSHPMIHVIRNSQNMGVAAARNQGILLAKGEFILPLDADDYIAETYFEKAIKLFSKRPDIGIIYCNAEFFGEKSGPWNLPSFSLTRMLIENLIFSAAFFKKSDWQRSVGYRSVMSAGWEDWDFWLTLISFGVQVEKIPDTLFKYRIRSDSRDRSLSLSKKAVLLFRIVHQHSGLYFRCPLSFLRLLINIGKKIYVS